MEVRLREFGVFIPVRPSKGIRCFCDGISRVDGFQTTGISPLARSEIHPDEVLLLQILQFENTTTSRCCHASFRHPRDVNDTPTPKGSMKMFLFVFYENLDTVCWYGGRAADFNRLTSNFSPSFDLSR